MEQERIISKRSLIHIKTAKVGEMDITHVSYNLRFWLLLFFAIFSFICSIFIIYRYLSNRKMRNGLHNHCIVLIIIINVLLIVTDIIWTLVSLHNTGRSPSATSSFCLIWWLFDDALYNSQTAILAWASIERHILIFHSKHVTTQKQKLIYHYLPPILLIIYIFTFHINVLFFQSCENSFNFNDLQCGSQPCYLGRNFLTIWDTIVNNAMPTVIITIFNFALLYRIIAQKKRLRQPIQWKKHRRMSMQLISLSAVYCFLDLPMVIFLFIQLIQDKDPDVSFISQLYLFIVTYSITLLLPFVVCLNSLTIDRQRHIRISATVTLPLYKKPFGQKIETIA
ncbi:unnamed protein product [Adineta steineri]|uniref:G-protein coupled receptors family 1 profile domain-containing protein n=1 Tax=Adineta steineri TaxID=433720 RepID=A0A814IZ12_9BILA|nr:unnamed protein product [Adineta steineri]CAF1102195.1 unnamed protein product [Adineta steineri]